MVKMRVPPKCQQEANSLKYDFKKAAVNWGHFTPSGNVLRMEEYKG